MILPDVTPITLSDDVTLQLLIGDDGNLYIKNLAFFDKSQEVYDLLAKVLGCHQSAVTFSKRHGHHWMATIDLEVQARVDNYTRSIASFTV